MNTSTPTRRYYLRSSENTARSSVAVRLPFNDVVAPVPLRKRNSPTEQGRRHKRQRTQQSHGLPFKSPDCLHPPRQVHIENERIIINLPKRLSLETESPYGNFGKLPHDVVFQVLSRTPYTLLGRMAMTSTSWHDAVLSYVKSGSFRLRWIADVENSPDSSSSKIRSEDLYFSMGTLIKYLTANDEWSTRLECLKAMFTMSYEIGSPIAGLGKMIYAFALRPDEQIDFSEIEDIVKMVLSVAGCLRDEIISAMRRSDFERNLGNREHLHVWFYEMELRKRITSLFLNNGSMDPAYGLNKFFLSCLMKILKEIDAVLPTSIFFLLFAPTTLHENDEVIHWHRLSEISVMTSEEARQLRPLARALYGLLQCRKLSIECPWSKNTVFNLMEEITTYPTPWSMNTFVSLHILEPDLVPIGVIARMNRSHEEEAGDIICTMKMLLHRWSMDVIGVMERAIEVIKLNLRAPQRHCLFDQCWKWHVRNMDELRERFGPTSDMRTELESQMEVMPLLTGLL
uniref:F-box domain-containing protein n=1 Tax=Caenorhabditis tropicalis TaxID=1561998 RepID=A0A1I7U602_9PELO